MPYLGYLALAALLAASGTLFFFSPRFSEWRVLSLPVADRFPETSRASDTLRQLLDPWVTIENPSNYVIQWRLLFPVLGHVLRLPPRVFLALPHVGCLAALMLIVHVAHRELQNRWAAFLAAVLAASCTWFFVSTSWLSYNDSWVILCLVTVTFVRSRSAVLAASFACPWIDERFLLLLPTCLGLRGYMLDQSLWLPTVLRDGARMLIGAMPYLVIRLVSNLRGHDAVTSSFAIEIWPTTWQMLDGIWAGLRCLWIYAVTFCWLARRMRPIWWGLPFAAATCLNFGAYLFIAADLGRSFSFFLPLGLAGLVLLARRHRGVCLRLLPWTVAANLLLPAWHSGMTLRIPICYLYTELARAHEPSMYLTADYYNSLGLEMLKYGQSGPALTQFEAAIQLNPHDSAARFNKASALISLGDYQAALNELNVVIEPGGLDPSDSPSDWYFVRGFCHESLRHREAAIADYQFAIRHAPNDWPSRGEASQRLERLLGNENQR